MTKTYISDKFLPLKALDEIDRDLLRILQAEGRISVTELAERVKLSNAATHARVRNLEAQGFISKYVALVNPDTVGYDLMCFIQIGFQMHKPDLLDQFSAAIQRIPEVQECFKITGDFDFMLKALVKDHRALDIFWRQLTSIPGVVRTHTSIVINEIKMTTAVQIV